jgi:hypothetical protein
VFDVDWLIDAAREMGGDAQVRWDGFRDVWLAVAHGAAQCGMPTLLAGPLMPGQLDSLPSRRWVADIHFLVLDCSDELRRARIEARPRWRSRDIEDQVAFGRWLRENIAERVDTGVGSSEDTAASVVVWGEGHLSRAPQ